MKNEYENETFFAQYAQMPRSKEGLSAAGEWHQLQRLMSELRGKRVLDLGCGYGWHCKYATDQGAAEVLGIDMSPKMLEEALRRGCVACYAAEGVYPPNLDYLKEHYGVQVDDARYVVIYSVFADNLMPDITVLVNEP